MTLKDLCEKIRMPEQVTQEILCADSGITPSVRARLIRDLRCADKYAAAYLQAQKLLAEDSDSRGIKMLKLALSAALDTKDSYDKTSIDMHVFFDTMACFSRFVREYKVSFGEYGFDRGWWVGRQLSLTLFRLGALEYEFTTLKERKAVSIHIPSDADLSANSVSQSLLTAERFIEKHFSEYADATFFCESWLLSPSLKNLLPPDSKIIGFADRFDIIETNFNASDYVLWVYKNSNLLPAQFPEDTVLQKNMKYYILGGGKIGSALGLLRA